VIFIFVRFVLFSELNISNWRSDVLRPMVATFRYIYGVGLEWGKNWTNCQFLKIHPDASTEAQKEDVSGETRTYGNPRYFIRTPACRVISLT